MGQIAPTLVLSENDDRWRYCCHLEGEVPIEFQLQSTRRGLPQEPSSYSHVPQTWHRQGAGGTVGQWAHQAPSPTWDPPPLSWGVVHEQSAPPERQGSCRSEEEHHFPEIVRRRPRRRLLTATATAEPTVAAVVEESASANEKVDSALEPR